MKWLNFTKSEMRNHLEEVFKEYDIFDEKSKWPSFGIKKKNPEFYYELLSVYTYTKDPKDDQKCQWYFSFYNIRWPESKVVAITEGISEFYKEQYEEIMRLEYLAKKASNKILSINDDLEGIRDWKLRKLI